jgi:hypothetical protein
MAKRRQGALQQASSVFKNATKDELKRMGFSPGSQRLIERNVKRVGKGTKSISRRAWLKLRALEKTGERLSLEKLAERRRTGEIAYRTAAAAEQAAKQRETRRRVALIDAALREPPAFSSRAVRPSSARRHGPLRYDISESRRGVRAALREKIIHEGYVEDGTWHGVMDWLRANDQEELANLFRSSGRSTPIL